MPAGQGLTKERAECLRFQRFNYDLRRLQVRQAMIGRCFDMFTNVFATLGPAGRLR